MVAGIGLSLLAMLGGGGVQFLQLREKLVTGVIGLAFVGSAAIGKPLIFELARATMRRRSEDEAQEFEALQIYAGFRRTMTVMTLVWGFGLLADVAVSVVLVFELSIREYLIVNPILGYATSGGLGAVVVLLWPESQAPREARRAALAAAQLELEKGSCSRGLLNRAKMPRPHAFYSLLEHCLNRMVNERSSSTCKVRPVCVASSLEHSRRLRQVWRQCRLEQPQS